MGVEITDNFCRGDQLMTGVRSCMVDTGRENSPPHQLTIPKVESGLSIQEAG